MLVDERASQDHGQKTRASKPMLPETQGSKQDKNPYYPAFDLLLAKLLAHEEILKVVPRMIPSDDDGAVEPTTSASNGDLSANPFQGFVADICEMRRDGFVRSFPTLRFSETAREARSRVIHTFRRRCCGWIVAQAFESFREFAEEIDQTIPKPQSAWEQFLECVYARVPLARRRVSNKSGLKNTLRRIRKTAPALQTCENRNSRGINLGSWISMLAVVRNAVAHTDAIISERRFTRLKSSSLEKEYPGNHIPGLGYALDLPEGVVQDTIQRLREYGLSIYKNVSVAAKHPVLLYDPDEGMTIWKR